MFGVLSRVLAKTEGNNPLALHRTIRYDCGIEVNLNTMTVVAIVIIFNHIKISHVNLLPSVVISQNPL